MTLVLVNKQTDEELTIRLVFRILESANVIMVYHEYVKVTEIVKAEYTVLNLLW